MTYHTNLKDSEEPNKKRRSKEAGNEKEESESILQFTDQEVQAAIVRLKKGKSADNSGTKVEDIEGCVEETKDDERNLQRRDNVQRYYTRCMEEGEKEKGFKK